MFLLDSRIVEWIVGAFPPSDDQYIILIIIISWISIICVTLGFAIFVSGVVYIIMLSLFGIDIGEERIKRGKEKREIGATWSELFDRNKQKQNLN
jgi:hypothetical protein